MKGTITYIKDVKEQDIDIREDTNLLLIFEDEYRQPNTININIDENTVLNITTYTNSKTSLSNIKINTKKNSKINHFNITLQAKKQKSIVYLETQSTYNNYTTNHSHNSNCILENNIYHLDNNSHSNTQIKSIASNNSQIQTSVLINIPNQAHNSTGNQKLKGILLDEQSQIINKPNLEIKNNDITCSHSASITQIDEKCLFYLNTRGLDKNQALNMLIESNFHETINKILSTKQKQTIIEKLEKKKIFQ